jgi:hypothetical protein
MKKRLQKKLRKKKDVAYGKRAEGSPESPELTKLLALECWRIKKLLPEFTENKKYLVLSSSIEKMLEALSKSGVDLEDPEGQEFREGMTLDVALFEDTASLAVGKSVISETLSPTLYVRDKLVQQARVIVSVGKRGE